MTTKRINPALEAIEHEGQHRLRTARFDLQAYQALPTGERAQRWQQWDVATKQQAVQLILLQKHGDWEDAEVALWVAHYDAKWVAGHAAPSDRPVPEAAEILVRAAEEQQLARRYGDVLSARQLDRLRANILRGARLWWQLGDLLIQSVNNPGTVYTANRRGCTCPNGAAGKATCWHVCAFDLLVGMQEDAAATADDRAAAHEEEEYTPARLGQRLAEARRRYAA